MLKPKAGESTLYEKAEAVLAVEAETIDDQPYVVFHLQMPPNFELRGMPKDSTVIVAVHLNRCEEVP